MATMLWTVSFFFQFKSSNLKIFSNGSSNSHFFFRIKKLAFDFFPQFFSPQNMLKSWDEEKLQKKGHSSSFLICFFFSFVRSVAWKPFKLDLFLYPSFIFAPKFIKWERKNYAHLMEKVKNHHHHCHRIEINWKFNRNIPLKCDLFQHNLFYSKKKET